MRNDPPVSDGGSEEDIEMDNEPPVIDPYEVLGLEKEATADDVKKAYRKLALKHHPDKAAESDKDAANKKFQEIAFAYAVLSDDRRRKRYDLTGSTAETLEDDDDFNWLKFYREQWEDVVNDEAIQRVSDEYKGSDEERRDLIKAYKMAKGKLDAIYELVMLSDILVDDDRFVQILNEEIEKGTLESYPAFGKESKATRQKAKDAERKRREDFDKKQAKKEKGEVADSKANGKGKSKVKKKAPNDMGDLAALIQQRQKSRAGNFFDHLEAKYAPKSRGSKRSTPMEEPSEEAFQATAARKKQKSNGRSKKAMVDEDEDDEMDLGEEDIVPSEEEEEEEEEEEDDDDEDEEKIKPRKSKTKAKTAPKTKGRSRTRTKA